MRLHGASKLDKAGACCLLRHTELARAAELPALTARTGPLPFCMANTTAPLMAIKRVELAMQKVTGMTTRHSVCSQQEL